MRSIRASAVLGVAFLGLFAGQARAQEMVVVKVPFSFVVHGQEMPSGTYQITADDGVLSIRGDDNRSMAFALTMPADGHDPAGDEPAVVFVQYENQNLLSQVWEASGEGLALPSRAVTPKHDRAKAQAQSSIVLTAEHDLSGQ
jgi:hypothetical protein